MFTLEQAREYFKDDRYAMETGAVIDEVGDGYAKVHCAVTEMHLNARGVVMGGVLFTLADFAFAVAANCGSQEVVSLQDQISYLSPVKGGVLTAEAKCIKSGRSTCLYEVTVTGDSGKKAAYVTVSGFVVGARE